MDGQSQRSLDCVSSYGDNVPGGEAVMDWGGGD